MKSASSIILLLVFGFVVISSSMAEMRGGPYSREYLFEMSSLVFVGTVDGITTNEKYNLIFPTSATIQEMLKGSFDDKVMIEFAYKDPGYFEIFEEEFNIPAVGQRGTFYIEQRRDGSHMLIGYITVTEHVPPGGRGEAPRP